MPDSKLDQDRRINDLEKSFMLMDHRLQSNEKILYEIKNVLVEQNKT